MQQVLNLLRLNHRNSLAYPENLVNLRARPSYQQVYNPHRRNFMRDDQNLIQYTSVDLNSRKKRKQVEDERPLSNRKKYLILEKEEQILMKKYNEGYPPIQKERVELPRIENLYTPRTQTVSTNGDRQSPNKQLKQKALKVRREKQKKMLLRAKKSFRKCVNCIIFINRIKKLIKNVSIISQINESIIKLSSDLNKNMMKMINDYYARPNILRVPLLECGQIMKKKMTTKSYIATQDIVNNLLKISEFLKLSSVRKDILKFLTLITLNNSPVPFNFFCEFELLRLKFDMKKLIILDVTEDQVRMIVGIFLGIKLFCNFIFYQPWNVQILQLSDKLDKKVKPIIWAYSSYFYTAFIKQFKHIQGDDSKLIAKLRDKGVKPLPVAQQNDQFYEKVSQRYKSESQRINANLVFWVNRISSEVLKRRQVYQQEINKNLHR